MNDIPLDHEANLLRKSAGGGGDVVRSGELRVLVGAFMEFPRDEQARLTIRAAGPDWVRDYDPAQIREIAAHPSFTGAFGAWDTANRAGDAERTADTARTIMEEGITGPAPT